MSVRTVLMGTAIAGTLDILSAIVIRLSSGKSVANMLRGIAAGPFGERAREWGSVGAVVGLAVHFAIMAAMVAAFALAARHFPAIRLRWAASGALYGLLLYALMYHLVLPLRWGAGAGGDGLRAALLPIAIHILLVGLPISWIVCRWASGDGRAGLASPL